MALNLDTLTSRLSMEQQTLRRSPRGALEETNRSSIALRLNAWRFAYGMWLDRPWFGWGAGTSDYWIRASGLPQLRDGTMWLAASA